MSFVKSVLHFVYVFPILSDLRAKYFGTRYMTKEEGLNVLNGKDWECLI